MIWRKILPLMFLAPDTGIIDATPARDVPASQTPPSEEAMPSVGEVYKQKMAELAVNPELADRDEDDEDDAAPPPQKAVKEKKAEEKAPEVKPPEEKAPEQNAVDAALEADQAPVEEKEEDPLADLPEVLPKEGRKENWGKARAKIAKLSGLLKETQIKIAESAKQAAERGTPPADWENERTELKNKLDEYKDAITALNVDYHPETQKRFVQGRAELVRKAADKTKAYGGASEFIVQAMGEPEGRVRNDLIKQALSELDPTEQSRVMHFITEVEKLDDEKADLQKDPQGAWAKLQASEKEANARRLELIEKNKRTVFDGVLGELPRGHFLLRTVNPALAGADEHNGFVEKAKAAAFRLLGADATPQELAEASVKSQLTDRYRDLYLASRKEVKTLMSRLSASEESSPDFVGRRPAAKSHDEALLDKTPGEIYNEMIASH